MKEKCTQCLDKYCIESISAIGKVRVTIDANSKEVKAVRTTLIKDCPIRLEKEQDDIEDRRNY